MIQPVVSATSMLDKKEKILFGLIVASRSVTGLFDVAGVLLIGLIAAKAAEIATGDSNSLVQIPILDNLFTDGSSSLMFLVIAALFLFVVKSLASLFLSRTQNLLISKAETTNASRLYSGLIKSNFELQASWPPQELAYALTSATNFAFVGILGSLANIITESFLLLVIGVALFVINPVIMLFVVVYFGILALILNKFIGKKHRTLGSQQANSQIRASNDVNESLRAFREIFAYSKAGFFVSRFERDRRIYSNASAEINYIQSIPRYTIELALILGISGLIGSQYLMGNLVSGAAIIGVFLAASMRIIGSLLPLQASVNLLSQSASLAEPAFKLSRQIKQCKSEDIDINTGTTKTFDAENGLSVSISNLSYTYQNSAALAINRLSLEINSGEFVAIIGPSGSGKSTLADLILGILEDKTDSINVSGLRPSEIEQICPGSIAYVPQRPGIIQGTISENIAFGVPAEEISPEKVQECLVKTGLSALVDNLPDGIDSILDSQNTSLSGGQIQRIGLARALYVEPKLLILDEATSALDAESESLVSNSLIDVAKGLTLVVIAHRLSTIQHADKVFVLENGNKIDEGTFKHLSKHSPLVSKYVELMQIES